MQRMHVVVCHRWQEKESRSSRHMAAGVVHPNQCSLAVTRILFKASHSKAFPSEMLDKWKICGPGGPRAVLLKP